ncbi:MAG: TIGR04211 family SH3 domain-containing protein [Deltaproteobacteria bacterium]|nr:TIGR04211 family SH3 domain-containing protein [Deltaproteobacteria bacterium]
MKPIVKKFGIVGICLVLFSTAVMAETKYINDKMKITLRTGPAKDRKIIALLNIGQKVKVLKPGEEWTQVRLDKGKEGWVVSRFLTNKVPSRIALEILKNKHKALSARDALLLEESKTLKAENKAFGNDLAATKKRLQALNTSHETLKKASAEFLDLQSKYKKMSAKLAEQTQKANKYEEDLTKLLWNKNIKWFLSGAGVLILGFIIGFSTKRQRRRSSLL